jgi:hypothetical protein
MERALRPLDPVMKILIITPVDFVCSVKPHGLKFSAGIQQNALYVYGKGSPPFRSGNENAYYNPG